MSQRSLRKLRRKKLDVKKKLNLKEKEELKFLEKDRNQILDEISQKFISGKDITGLIQFFNEKTNNTNISALTNTLEIIILVNKTLNNEKLTKFKKSLQSKISNLIDKKREEEEYNKLINEVLKRNLSFKGNENFDIFLFNKKTEFLNELFSKEKSIMIKEEDKTIVKNIEPTQLFDKFESFYNYLFQNKEKKEVDTYAKSVIYALAEPVINLINYHQKFKKNYLDHFVDPLYKNKNEFIYTYNILSLYLNEINKNLSKNRLLYKYIISNITLVLSELTLSLLNYNENVKNANRLYLLVLIKKIEEISKKLNISVEKELYKNFNKFPVEIDETVKPREQMLELINSFEQSVEKSDESKIKSISEKYLEQIEKKRNKLFEKIDFELKKATGLKKIILTVLSKFKNNKNIPVHWLEQFLFPQANKLFVYRFTKISHTFNLYPKYAFIHNDTPKSFDIWLKETLDTGEYFNTYFKYIQAAIKHDLIIVKNSNFGVIFEEDKNPKSEIVPEVEKIKKELQSKYDDLYKKHVSLKKKTVRFEYPQPSSDTILKILELVKVVQEKHGNDVSEISEQIQKLKSGIEFNTIDIKNQISELEKLPQSKTIQDEIIMLKEKLSIQDDNLVNQRTFEEMKEIIEARQASIAFGNNEDVLEQNKETLKNLVESRLKNIFDKLKIKTVDDLDLLNSKKTISKKEKNILIAKLQELFLRNDKIIYFKSKAFLKDTFQKTTSYYIKSKLLSELINNMIYIYLFENYNGRIKLDSDLYKGLKSMNFELSSELYTPLFKINYFNTIYNFSIQLYNNFNKKSLEFVKKEKQLEDLDEEELKEIAKSFGIKEKSKNELISKVKKISKPKFNFTNILKESFEEYKRIYKETLQKIELFYPNSLFNHKNLIEQIKEQLKLNSKYDENINLKTLKNVILPDEFIKIFLQTYYYQYGDSKDENFKKYIKNNEKLKINATWPEIRNALLQIYNKRIYNIKELNNKLLTFKKIKSINKNTGEEKLLRELHGTRLEFLPKNFVTLFTKSEELHTHIANMKNFDNILKYMKDELKSYNEIEIYLQRYRNIIYVCPKCDRAKTSEQEPLLTQKNSFKIIKPYQFKNQYMSPYSPFSGSFNEVLEHIKKYKLKLTENDLEEQQKNMYDSYLKDMFNHFEYKGGILKNEKNNNKFDLNEALKLDDLRDKSYIYMKYCDKNVGFTIKTHMFKNNKCKFCDRTVDEIQTDAHNFKDKKVDKFVSELGGYVSKLFDVYCFTSESSNIFQDKCKNPKNVNFIIPVEESWKLLRKLTHVNSIVLDSLTNILKSYAKSLNSDEHNLEKLNNLSNLKNNKKEIKISPLHHDDDFVKQFGLPDKFFNDKFNKLHSETKKLSGGKYSQKEITKVNIKIKENKDKLKIFLQNNLLNYLSAQYPENTFSSEINKFDNSYEKMINQLEKNTDDNIISRKTRLQNVLKQIFNPLILLSNNHKNVYMRTAFVRSALKKKPKLKLKQKKAKSSKITVIHSKEYIRQIFEKFQEKKCEKGRGKDKFSKVELENFYKKLNLKFKKSHSKDDLCKELVEYFNKN